MWFSKEYLNFDNTNKRKVKVPFDSPVELAKAIREVNDDLRDIVRDLDGHEDTQGVGEVDHAGVEVGVEDPPLLCVWTPFLILILLLVS